MTRWVGVLALLLGGCGGNSAVHFSSGGGPAPAAGASASIVVETGSAFGAFLGLGFIAGMVESEAELATRRLPGLDPSRRVQEHDCRQPIADLTANLRCR